MIKKDKLFKILYFRSDLTFLSVASQKKFALALNLIAASYRDKLSKVCILEVI